MTWLGLGLLQMAFFRRNWSNGFRPTQPHFAGRASIGVSPPCRAEKGGRRYIVCTLVRFHA